MTKAFTMFLWENDPSVNTPLSEDNLNKINNAIDTIDDRVVTMDTTKANQADLLTALADITYDEKTGIFTLVKKNGATTKLDTNLEKLAVNLDFDYNTQQFILTLSDGTKKYIDAKALVTELDFLNSDTVLFSVTDGKVSASIAKGSITADMLEPNYLANVQLYASQALTSANNAKTSEENAVASATKSEENANLAKQYSDSASDTLKEIVKRTSLAEFDIDENGNLIYTDETAYNFSVNENGYLIWEVAE